MIGEPPVPEIDLAFAISATATDADDTFSRIKDTAKFIVNKYGTQKIHYGLLVFGTAPSRVRDFRQEMISKEDMIRILDAVPRSSTGKNDSEFKTRIALLNTFSVNHNFSNRKTSS